MAEKIEVKGRNLHSGFVVRCTSVEEFLLVEAKACLSGFEWGADSMMRTICVRAVLKEIADGHEVVMILPFEKGDLSWDTLESWLRATKDGRQSDYDMVHARAYLHRKYHALPDELVFVGREVRNGC